MIGHANIYQINKAQYNSHTKVLNDSMSYKFFVKMTDNKPRTRLQSSLLNKELQGNSKILFYSPKSYVTSDVAHTSDYNLIAISMYCTIYKLFKLIFIVYFVNYL